MVLLVYKVSQAKNGPKSDRRYNVGSTKTRTDEKNLSEQKKGRNI